MKTHHTFLTCCFCSMYEPITKNADRSLHANCEQLRDRGCIIQDVLLGNTAAYKSITPIPTPIPDGFIWNIKREPQHDNPYRAYTSKTDEPVRYDNNLVRLIDWCNRRGAMHRLLFTPTEEERTNTLHHICI